MQQPSLTQFEQAVTQQQHDIAGQQLLAILTSLSVHFGEVHAIEMDLPQGQSLTPQAKARLFSSRMAQAVTDLFCQPALRFTDEGVKSLIALQSWLAFVFANSPYGNADHILQELELDLSGGLDQTLAIKRSELHKFCILYFPLSKVRLNMELLWNIRPELCAALCFALCAPSFAGSPLAFKKRHVILQWLPPKLAQLENYPALQSFAAYMYCSYDTHPDKHQIKAGINQLIRSHLEQNGWQDRDVRSFNRINGKPVMVVLLEYFNNTHSIFRTHSTSLRAACEQFYLIGIGNQQVDKIGRAVFDRFYRLDSHDNAEINLHKVRQICEQQRPAVLYMPSVGMDLTTIWASNTRLAPIQAMALGHPATTHSRYIDYVLVEDDYVGEEACFSETLLRLPKDALPYVPSVLAPQQMDYTLRENPHVVHIGVAATVMKINPLFLQACREIRDRAKVKVHFHFALGASVGILHEPVKQCLHDYLGEDVTAYPQTFYPAYLMTLKQCDMMINPFPFGNTNGIIDMVTLGLVGVCKTGREVHEHIDEGLFKRLGLPDWLIADSVEGYIERAIRLAENHHERLALRRHIIAHNGLQTLFRGDPSPLGKVLRAKVEQLPQR